jgi:two-component system OmpR family response regulator
VLEALMQEPGAVLSRFDLLEQAWGYQYENRSNVVEVYIRYLREKIDRPFGRETLQTIRGVGYRICAER